MKGCKVNIETGNNLKLNIIIVLVSVLLVENIFVVAALHKKLTNFRRPISKKTLIHRSAAYTKGELGNLYRYTGTYETDGFMNEPQVSEELKKMGKADLKQLKTNLSTGGPIEFFNSYYIVQGNKAHSGDSDIALLMVNNYNKKFYAVIVSKPNMKVITNETDRKEFIEHYVKYWVNDNEDRYDIKNIEYIFLK
jgi:hypothetical protein